MLTGFTPRLYQETILSTAAQKNTLVVLPTGMGKTGIALLLAAQRLYQYPSSKILMLAPTKPLAEQHLATFKRSLAVPENHFALFTGNVSPVERAELWKNARIIFSTPQGLENDVIGDKIDLSTVSLLIFDEAHRATGDYSYVFLAKQYTKRATSPRILALSASPGSDMDKIEEICTNLFIEAVEVRTDKDPDVAPYVQEVDVEWVKVELPADFKKVKNLLDQCIKRKTDDLRGCGVKGSLLSRKDLLLLQGQLQVQMSNGERDFGVLKALSVLAEIIKAQHALELLESQGIGPLNKYLETLFSSAESSKVKAVKNLTQDPSFKGAFFLAQQLLLNKREHPKIQALTDFFTKETIRNKNMKVILFTQYRDTAVKLSEEVNKVKGVLAKVFVGQQKKDGIGLSQKQQAEMLDWFRDGLFNVLIATSVAEEGLDIPKVDCVIFYEPIPSAIRSIQRRGRTGRLERGRVIMFMTKGTREEAYSWSAKRKEARMADALQSMKTTLTLEPAQQQTLASFDEKTEEKVKIFADYREKSDGTIKELVDLGAAIKLEMLESADYILSSRVGVELKLAPDFVQSIIDGRLLEQLRSLKKNFERPIVIIQGPQDIYSVRNIHPNAIRGMLCTIAISYGIPIIQTRDEKDTAALLLSIAKREQEEVKRDFSPHANRKPMSLPEQQEYIVTCVPNVGLNLARELLKTFGSVKGIFMASIEELRKVDGVGEKIAKLISDISTLPYK